MAHWCRQAKHVIWFAIVVDMAMGAVAVFSFQYLDISIFKHFSFQ
jgi:hypothetical protein